MNKNLTASLLTVLEKNILPLTEKGVSEGNKIFGAAILKKEDYSLVIAGVNQETKNPLFHGEVSCLNAYWKLPISQRPTPKDCIFFSTHEPCSMCLSAITWSGFDNFYYYFSYENSKDDFFIPHDLKMLDEVFDCKEGNYRKKNFYWQSYSIRKMVSDAPEQEKKDYLERMKKIDESYQKFSSIYQQKKEQGEIPLN